MHELWYTWYEGTDVEAKDKGCGLSNFDETGSPFQGQIERRRASN